MKWNDRIFLAKLAQNYIDIGNPNEAGKDIAEILKLLMRRINFTVRPFRMEKLRSKLLAINEIEISSKKIPETAVLGQCISLVKNVLHGQNSHYVKQVIHSIIRNL